MLAALKDNVKFPLPMRGNEWFNPHLFFNGDRFPLPLRGNEDQALRAIGEPELFPLPMRGNETTGFAAPGCRLSRFSLPMRGNKRKPAPRLTPPSSSLPAATIPRGP